MHLNDCEISTREVRGHRLVILFGDRKLTAAEGSALLALYYATYTGPAPMYASPQGWQVLEPAGAAVEAVAPVAPPAAAADAAPEQPAEPPAKKPPAKK